MNESEALRDTTFDDASLVGVDRDLRDIADATAPRAAFLEIYLPHLRQAATEAFPPVAASQTHTRPRRIALHRWQAVVGIATAAALILAVGFGAFLWVVRPQSVSAEAVIKKAAALSNADLSAAGIQSFHIKYESTDAFSFPDGGHGVSTSTDESWGALPNRWRQDQTVQIVQSDSPSVPLSAGRTYGWIAHSASDGTTLWSSRTETGSRPQPPTTRHIAPASQRQSEPQGSGYMEPTGTAVYVGALPDGVEVTLPTTAFASPNPTDGQPLPPGSVAQLLDQASRCYHPQLEGETTVAGRAAYVINLGPSSCSFGYEIKPSGTVVPGPTQSPEKQGRNSIWIDKETFFLLKSERYAPDGTLLMRREATEVQYNDTLPDALFAYQPTPDATVTDFRPGDYQSQPGVPLPLSVTYKDGQRRPTVAAPTPQRP
ncbi:MAG: hypothetical protein ACR2M3_20725 [Thermomicrobiales bacterium]